MKTEFDNKLDYMSAIGLDMLGHCLTTKVEAPLDSPNYTFKLNILGVSYNLSVPSADVDTQEGIRNVWQHLLTQFNLNHERGFQMIQEVQKYKKLDTEGPVTLFT
jgi:hypothetical protein